MRISLKSIGKLLGQGFLFYQMNKEQIDPKLKPLLKGLKDKKRTSTPLDTK